MNDPVVKRFGILNLTSNTPLYGYFDTIKEEYYKKLGILYKRILNEPKERETRCDELLYISECKHPSGVPVMFEKFQWALRLLLAQPEWADCEYIIRTNASTFINLELLENYLCMLPKRRCYAGAVQFGRFVSGTCIVLSMDLARYLSKVNIEKYKNSYDDVAISRLMDRRLVRMRDIPMKFFIDNVIHDENDIRDALEHFALIRVKNDADRMLYDIDVWKKIAEIKGIQKPEQMIINADRVRE